MVFLTGVVEEVALMVVPVQIGIGDFTFEEVVIGYVVDSKILYLSILVARVFLGVWRCPCLLWHRWMPRLGVFWDLWTL